MALTALLGIFIPAYLFAIAETKIGSSITGVLNALTPLNSLILGGLLFGLTFKRAQILGVSIGFLGSLMLVFTGNDIHKRLLIMGMCLLFLLPRFVVTVSMSILSKSTFPT